MPELFKVFVYGTLMRGERNHDFIPEAEFLYEKKTKPLYSLYSLGAYPAMSEDGNTSVKGEVFQVNKSDLRSMDRLEGHPEHYERKMIKLSDNEEVWTYIMLKNTVMEDDGEIIPSGDWKKFRLSRK